MKIYLCLYLLGFNFLTFLVVYVAFFLIKKNQTIKEKGIPLLPFIIGFILYSCLIFYVFCNIVSQQSYFIFLSFVPLSLFLFLLVLTIIVMYLLIKYTSNGFRALSTFIICVVFLVMGGLLINESVKCLLDSQESSLVTYVGEYEVKSGGAQTTDTVILHDTNITLASQSYIDEGYFYGEIKYGKYTKTVFNIIEPIVIEKNNQANQGTGT